MRDHDSSGTIAAIATLVGESGISIVRLSGKQALSIADKIFLSKDPKKPSQFKTYTLHYGSIARGLKQPEIIDEVILSIMRAPRSYTREDVVEINCHGGIIATRRVLDLVLENGARLAEPGEFTKRAFLNGRIDLSQAEAVLDVIRAKTESALKIGLNQLRGELSKKVSRLRARMLDMLKSLEANIDFPDEDLGSFDLKAVSLNLNGIHSELSEIIENARYGRFFREGLKVVICGRPNTGKSSLLNALLQEERSIVTPIPGTTRDTIEEIIDIKGIPLRVIDTAGILEPRDLIEKKAIQRSKAHIRQADLVILLLDGSAALHKSDYLLISRLKKKNTVAVINKIDLKQKIKKSRIVKKFGQAIGISAKKRKNIDALEEAIENWAYGGRLFDPESILSANLRHIQIIKETQKAVARALNSSDNKLSPEYICEDIRNALGLLDGLLGRRFSEDLLDKIFSDFCVGK